MLYFTCLPVWVLIKKLLNHYLRHGWRTSGFDASSYLTFKLSYAPILRYVLKSSFWYDLKGKRMYTNSAITSCSYSPQQRLDPWAVTGFTDGEGCFILSITENENYKVGWRVQIIFSIQLNCRDDDILKQIQTYFCGVGSISKKSKNNSIEFLVRSIENMKIIVKHFDNYTLITEKWSDFHLLKKNF